MTPDELHIVVIEDNTDHQLLAEMAIKRLNRQTKLTMCDSGEEVMDLINQGQLRPDIILLDVQLMNGMDGFEVARLIRQHEETRQSCIIMFTGHANPEYMEKAQEVGAFAYLVKDIDMSITVTKLKKLIEMWQSEAPHAFV